MFIKNYIIFMSLIIIYDSYSAANDCLICLCFSTNYCKRCCCFESILNDSSFTENMRTTSFFGGCCCGFQFKKHGYTYCDPSVCIWTCLCTKYCREKRKIVLKNSIIIIQPTESIEKITHISNDFDSIKISARSIDSSMSYSRQSDIDIIKTLKSLENVDYATEL